LAASRSGRPAARSLLAPAASLLAAAALAGCGPFGDDESDEEDFAQRGDEICREARAQFAELQLDLPTTEKQSVRFTQRLIAIFEDELAQLEALEPPADRRAAFKRYLQARRRAIGYIEDGSPPRRGKTRSPTRTPSPRSRRSRSSARSWPSGPDSASAASR
jgi:hypothetical protein